MIRRRAPASPLRMEIVDELRDRGSSSIAELAAALVRPQPSLYYHVHRLVKAGVVRGKEKRQAGAAGWRPSTARAQGCALGV